MNHQGSVLLLAAAFGSLGSARYATAQVYPPVDPPRIYTIPADVRPNQPFQIGIETLVIAGTVGPWSIWVDRESRFIEIAFDYFCGWICPGPGEPGMHTFFLNMPALPQGDYTIRLTGETSMDVPLRIAAGAFPVPTLDSFSIHWLIALILASAFLRLRPHLNGNSSRHG